GREAAAGTPSDQGGTRPVSGELQPPFSDRPRIGSLGCRALSGSAVCCHQCPAPVSQLLFHRDELGLSDCIGSDMSANLMNVRCCIAGGGPAGMMLGLLLARAGVEVLVLEKHADFLRDFRGDTIHPSTLEVMHELGLLEELLRLPHTKAPRLNAHVSGMGLTI